MAVASMSVVTCSARNNGAPRPTGPIASARPNNVRAKALRERAVAGLTAAALTAAAVAPGVASAAESGGLPPSLKNFLLSIAAGGVVLTAIIGAVVGVSNFDPVNRT